MKNAIKILIIITAGVMSFFLINNIAIKITVCMGAALSVFFVISEKKYREYCRKKFPGTVGSKQRNFDCMLLGKYNKEQKQNNTLDLSGYGRNFYTDCLIVERYFSFLRPHGVVKIMIDASDSRYLLKEKISRFDITALHEVTLWEHGIDKRCRWYNVYLKVIGALFVLGTISTPMVRNYRGMPIQKMKNIIEFCKERELQVIFVIANLPKDRQHDISSIKENVIQYEKN